MKKKVWTKSTCQKLRAELKKHQDKEFQLFSKKTIPTSYPMIGVRTPILTEFHKKIRKTDLSEFLDSFDAKYYEEVLLKGFVIASIKKPEEQISYLKKFLDQIDNWAVCDMTIARMKLVKKHQDEYFPFVMQCLQSKKEFSIRFGFVLLLNYYVEEKHLDQIFEFCHIYNTNDYYVQMAVAWLLSYCYLEDKEKTLDYLNSNQLDTFTHNKVISKIRESLRVSEEEKNMLKKYMI